MIKSLAAISLISCTIFLIGCSDCQLTSENDCSSEFIETRYDDATTLSGLTRISGLNKAVEDGNLDLVKCFISAYPDSVNLHERFNGYAPLHVAAAKGDLNIIKFLIDHKADLNITDTFLSTPLHQIAQQGCFFQFSHLDCNQQQQMIKQMNSIDSATFLLNHGASINVKDDKGNTPLHYAACCNSAQLAELFIRHGAEVNSRNNLGNTPLHEAINSYPYCFLEHREGMIITLLDHGSDVSIRNEAGQTPLHLAISKDKQIVLLLCSHGANALVQDNEKQTPLDLANKLGKIEIINILNENCSH